MPRERKPQRIRSARFLLLTIGSGVIAALLALAIEGIPVVLSLAFPPSSPPQLSAGAVFPSVGPQHKVVDVYDPPPKQQPKPTAASSPVPTAWPSRPPGTPRPTLSPDT